MRVRRRAGVVVVLVCLLTGLITACDVGTAEDREVVRVGAGSTTEQQILAALAAGVLQRNGRTAEIVPDLGDSARVRETALEDDIDVYWDYSGATWTLSLGLTAPPVDAQESFEAVAAEELERGLRWLGPTQVDARLSFFIPLADQPAPEDRTLSWLASTLAPGSGGLCADAEYLAAPSGFSYLADVYAIAADSVTTVAATEVAALELTAGGDCAAGLASSTSGVARGLDLVPLRDDQGVFPALTLAPVVVVDGRVDDTVSVGLLETLAGLIDTERLATLSAQADAGTPIDRVAARFLDAAGLG